MVSGCAGNVAEIVRDNEVVVKIDPITIPEYTEKNVSVIITNMNQTYPIYAVSVRSVSNLALVERNQVGGILPGDTVKIEFKVKAGAVGSTDTTTIRLSSIVSPDGNGVVVKDITVPVTIAPNVKLEMSGLTTTDPEGPIAPAIMVGRGYPVYVVYQVKNYGEYTIPEKTLWVRATIKNQAIGGNRSAWIYESMAFAGTSSRSYIPLDILDDAPNGQTDINLQLLMGNAVIDEKKLVIKVAL